MHQTEPVADATETEPDGDRDDDERVERAVRFVPAPPEAIFELLVDPSKHALIDGSGTVRGSTEVSTQRLELGSTFEMSMRFGVPYKMVNEVIEFEEPTLIAWRHMGGHVWRWQLRPVDGGTEVTEEFDWRPSRAPLLSLIHI